jgi:Domain of unknown function (DUF4830)
MQVLQTLVLMLTFMNIFACRGNGQTVKLADNSVKPVESPDSKPKVKIGEQFTLKMHESAKVEGADIEITLNRIGRKWLANGGGESLDFDFSVKHDGKIENYSHLPLTLIRAGEYKIEVVKTEPFGDGDAIFVVTKIDSVKTPDSNDETAAKFVEQFGWHIDEAVPPTEIPIEFPKTFDGIPFYHYQLASKNSGVDMTPMLGKKAAILKYTLKEKQSEQGEDFTIYAHLIVENGKVVGAWRTDSSSREPGIYSFDKK